MVGYVDPFLAMLFSNPRARRSCSKLLYVYPLICWMYLARLSRLMSLRVPRQSTQNRIEFDYDGINMDATGCSGLFGVSGLSRLFGLFGLFCLFG
jgi:hypothetical protein